VAADMKPLWILRIKPGKHPEILRAVVGGIPSSASLATLTSAEAGRSCSRPAPKAEAYQGRGVKRSTLYS
jgi:hypothetical protein